jgi:hypothetical protein
MRSVSGTIIISGSIVLVRDLAATHRRFRNLIKTLDITPSDEWSSRRKGLCLHRNTKTNIHASSEIRTHDPSNQEAKTYTLDGATTGTGSKWYNEAKIRLWDFKFSRRRVWRSDLSSGMPWWWGQHVPLKRRSTIILHGSTSQKTNLDKIGPLIRIRVFLFFALLAVHVDEARL